MEQYTILVVDDDLHIQDTVCFALEQEGYKVLRASNGLEALGAVRAVQPDLVVLDVIMPGENGYRVSRVIKDDVEKGVYTKNIIVLLLTAKMAHDPNKVKEAKKTSGADYVMFKPFKISELTDKVCALLLSEMEVNND